MEVVFNLTTTEEIKLVKNGLRILYEKMKEQNELGTTEYKVRTLIETCDRVLKMEGEG
jgi:fructose-bisphosphate aldolase class 1